MIHVAYPAVYFMEVPVPNFGLTWLSLNNFKKCTFHP